MIDPSDRFPSLPWVICVFRGGAWQNKSLRQCRPSLTRAGHYLLSLAALKGRRLSRGSMLPVVKKLNSFLPYPCPAIVKPPLRPVPSPTSMLQVFSPRGVANRRAERPLRLSPLLNAAARKREVIVRKVSYEDGPAFSSTRETKRWLVVERRQLFSVNTFSPRTFPRNFRRTRRTRRGAVRPRKLPLGARRETVCIYPVSKVKSSPGVITL